MARPIIRPPSARKPIGVALQGGGSWGAYTWGVLDALLASRSITITQPSGTSAGAMNAAVIASALANGSPAQARKALRSFWLSFTSNSRKPKLQMPASNLRLNVNITALSHAA